MSTNEKLIVLIGPTAVGKTALSLDIAEKFDFDIISGDSMQVYEHMDILTGKIKPEEMRGIVHHMIDIKKPEESFSVHDFKLEVDDLIDTYHENDKIPFIVGGTGHYIRALIYDYDFHDEDDADKRELMERLDKLSTTILYGRLKEISEDLASKVHPNNRQRILRQLIKFELSERISHRRAVKDSDYQHKPKYDTFIIGLERERSILYDRINERVEDMFDNGIAEEAEKLYKEHKLSTTAKGAIGYKEFLPYFEGDISLQQVKENIKQNTRHFAKRQLTFFRNQLDVNWYDMEDETSKEKIFDDLNQFLRT
ncbi:tRNA (adenosine(37)-N6)-dimethylallyltransferase MiaA [Salinicoccus halitifaciens]|uniref:tRNA dimethylallyltransferase n=1 Tax=Salinicoccus halitifaciens TaxID=1073415 RepID=A0ABV2E744_9STAP|nr:tRNA (adenosine(37)-N6)-dimethylallyltransferase MiaA [Salinicoccus halitifaciens]MCD2136706.1 tRNA (adenosine(37)-N6)-dimethylallyltransferase MiaA [Salinicoccus halitifaciens]